MHLFGHYWFSELVGNERQQDPPSWTLLVPKQSQTLSCWSGVAATSHFFNMQNLQQSIVSQIEWVGNKLLTHFTLVSMGPQPSPFLWQFRNRTVHKALLTHSLLNFTSGVFMFFERKQVPWLRTHTCTKCFVKSKIGSRRASNSCNHDREC